jgi:hypothetical protein
MSLIIYCELKKKVVKLVICYVVAVLCEDTTHHIHLFIYIKKKTSKTIQF